MFNYCPALNGVPRSDSMMQLRNNFAAASPLEASSQSKIQIQKNRQTQMTPLTPPTRDIVITTDRAPCSLASQTGAFPRSVPRRRVGEPSHERGQGWSKAEGNSPTNLVGELRGRPPLPGSPSIFLLHEKATLELGSPNPKARVRLGLLGGGGGGLLGLGVGVLGQGVPVGAGDGESGAEPVERGHGVLEENHARHDHHDAADPSKTDTQTSVFNRRSSDDCIYL
eukprot:1177264-Prorocentrum_minimum.AAC.4